MKCNTCGGVEFTKEDCYYYCNECQTRCEELVERVVEEDYIDKDKIEFRTNITSRNVAAEGGYQWTTWEAYNYIMKGMVDELIKLGALPKFKVTVLQLWARYLQILKVAFLPLGLLPKLGPAYNPRDAKVVYSMKAKESIKRKRCSVSSVAGSDRLSLSKARGRAKKALAKSEQSHSEVSSYASTSVSELSFISSRSLRKDKFMTKVGLEWDKKKRKKGRSSGIGNYHSSVEKISRLKLLGILHLGLLLCEDKIQLSDILRWIREGHLSYYSVIHFLPTAMVLNGRDRLSFGSCSNAPSYSMVRKVAGQIAHKLGIESIPLPDFPYLIHKYIKELELPEEMADFAVNLWAAYPPKMQINEEEKSKDAMAMFDVNPWAGNSPEKLINEVGKSKSLDSWIGKGVAELPNYEGRAMAIVLYSMKLIFGLDGFTELKLSQFARKANKVLSHQLSHKKFFVWADWMKYIEFRNQLVERFHFPSSYSDEPEQIYLFRDHYSVVPSLPLSQNFYKSVKFLENFSELNGRCEKKGGAEWRRFMKKELDEIIRNEVHLHFEQLSVKFEPSVTPCFSYFKQLNDDMVLRKLWTRNVNGGPCEQLLKASFSETSLVYVLSPRRCIQDLIDNGLSVTVIEGPSCSADDVKFVQPVQIIRETNSACPSTKKDSVEVVLTEDSDKSKKRIRWFEKIDKAKLLLNINSKKKVPVKADREVLRKLKNINCRKPAKKRGKSKTNHKERLKYPAKELSEKNLMLYLPYRKVWMFYGTFLDLSELQFYYLAQRFPSSFQWLLTLCAKSLEMSEVSLYSEIVDVELVHKSNQSEGTSRKNRDPEIVYENRRTAFARNNW